MYFHASNGWRLVADSRRTEMFNENVMADADLSRSRRFYRIIRYLVFMTQFLFIMDESL